MTSDSDGCIAAPDEACLQGRRRMAFSRQTSRISDTMDSRGSNIMEVKHHRHPRRSSSSVEISNLHLSLAESGRSNSIGRQSLVASVCSSLQLVKGDRRLQAVKKSYTGRYRKDLGHVWCKLFNKQMLADSQIEALHREVKIMEQLKTTPGAVKLRDVIETDTELLVVTARAPGMPLIEVIASSGGHMSERRCAVEVITPLLQALAKIHERGFVHCSLQPEHVICNMAEITILDFHEAIDLTDDSCHHRKGQKEYSAPEVLEQPKPEDIFHLVLIKGMDESELPRFDEKADIWSVGVLAYEMLTGCQPFRGETAQEVLTMQRTLLKGSNEVQVPDFLTQHRLSAGAENFISAALQIDPAKRPSAAQLSNDPWLTSLMTSFRACSHRSLQP